MDLGKRNTYKDVLESLKVETSFKLKYHGDNLDKMVWNNTTTKHNELIEYLIGELNDLRKEINKLKEK